MGAADPVEVLDPPRHNGVAVDNPRMKEYIRNCFKLGYGNEHIIRLTGAAQSVVSSMRSRYEQEKREHKK